MKFILFPILYKFGYYKKITENSDIKCELFWFFVLNSHIYTLKYSINLELKDYLRNNLNANTNIILPDFNAI